MIKLIFTEKLKTAGIHAFHFEGIEYPHFHLVEVAHAMGYCYQRKGRLVEVFGGQAYDLSLKTIRALRSVNPILPGRRTVSRTPLINAMDFITGAEEAALKARMLPKHRKSLAELIVKIKADLSELGREMRERRAAAEAKKKPSAPPEKKKPSPTRKPRTTTFAQRAEASREQFNRFVLPELPRLIPGLLEVLPVEGVDGKLTACLDRFCGVDYLLLCRKVVDGGEALHLHGLSSRVTNTTRCFQNFTMAVTASTRRHVSEYHRRKRAMDDGEGAIVSSWILQADTDGERLLGVAVAKTQDVVKAISRATSRLDPKTSRQWARSDSDSPLTSPCGVSWRRNRSSGVIFASVPWSRVQSEVIINDAHRNATDSNPSQACLWATLGR